MWLMDVYRVQCTDTGGLSLLLHESRSLTLSTLSLIGKIRTALTGIVTLCIGTHKSQECHIGEITVYMYLIPLDLPTG